MKKLSQKVQILVKHPIVTHNPKITKNPCFFFLSGMVDMHLYYNLGMLGKGKKSLQELCYCQRIRIRVTIMFVEKYGLSHNKGSYFTFFFLFSLLSG